MNGWNLGAVATFVVGSLQAGCARSEKPAELGSTASTPNVVSLTATENGFEAPDTVTAGWITFRMANHGNDVHYGHIVRLAPGRTAAELLAAYGEAIRTSAPRPEWLTRFGGPGGAGPGDSSSVTQRLEPGNYLWICPVEDETGTPHFGKGQFKPFVVVEATGGDPARQAAAPAATIAIRLLDYSFGVDAPIRAGRHIVRVENAGADAHDVNVMKLAPGKTVEDFRKWLNPERARRPEEASEPPPPLSTLGTGAGGAAAMAPGMEAFFETDFTPGEYVFFCMATAPDGRSHIEHGMIRQVTVQ